jgi:hypothetical protein
MSCRMATWWSSASTTSFVASMKIIKPLIPDPALDAFDGGVGLLTRDGKIAGHVAASRSWFWSPSSPLRKQWCVWYIVIWADGSRERSAEDYPPWSAVTELGDEYLEWVSRDTVRNGRYDFAWLDPDTATATLLRLGIVAGDF